MVSGAALIAWIYLLLFRGRFWRVRSEDAAPQAAAGAGSAPRIAAIVPARNEAALIAISVVSLLDQDIEGELRVWVVDDHSDDSTRLRAIEAAKRQAEERATVIAAPGLPPGWTGKLWALSQGIEAARQFVPDYLLLTDADIEHAPGSVRSLVARCEAGRLDLASYMVRLHCESFAERALIPAFLFFFLKLYPPDRISDPGWRTAGAAGGCILIRPEALDRAGGIAAIRDEIIDDCALARRVKSAGGRIWMGVTSETRSVREYRDFGEIWNMIARTAFTQLKHSTPLLIGTIIGMMALYVAPIAALFTGDRAAAASGFAAWALMSAVYAPAVRFYRLSPLWAMTLPAAATFYTGATVCSAVRYWRGRGGQWKGRVQNLKGNQTRRSRVSSAAKSRGFTQP